MTTKFKTTITSPITSICRRILAPLLLLALHFEGSFAPPALAAPGDVDPGFNPTAGGSFPYVFSVAVQANGQILIGGRFTTIGGMTRDHLARLGPDGSLDPNFSPFVNNDVNCIAVQPDGQVLIGGPFFSVVSSPRNGIARLNSGAIVDSSFNPNLGGGPEPHLDAIAIEQDGDIVIGGNFHSVGGTARRRIARLQTTGALDGFDPDASGRVFSVAIQEGGSMLIGGSFAAVGGTPRSRVARVNSVGVLDTTFNPNANGLVASIAMQPDGRIIIGGGFTTIGGIPRHRIARLETTGALDAGFNPAVNGDVYSSVVQADGKILIVGEFTYVTNSGVATPRSFIARLNPDGTLDTGFNPTVDNTILGVALQADGKLLLVGAFSAVGGVPRRGIALLENDPATQSLTVPNIARVQWLRGGSSPEAQDVSFEQSTDAGATWNPVGTGTRIAGGWELTGPSLPASGLIRGRARVTGGQYNGSAGLVQTVVAYQPAPTPPTVANPTPDFAVNVIEGAPDTVLDLRAVFEDAETPDADLVYSLQANNNPTLVAAAVNNAADTLTLDYQLNQYGAATITVRATDDSGLFVEDTFMVTVNPDVNPGAPAQLFIAYDGTNAIITWPSYGCILQCATNDVRGPYVTVVGATAPYVTRATEKCAFYRLCCPGTQQSVFELPRTPIADPETFASPGSRAVQDRGELGAPHVDTALGESVIEACDLKLNGPSGIGLDLNFCRLYRSGWWRPSGPLGNRWTHNYDIYIQRSGDCIKVFNGDLRWDLYCLQPDGTYGSDQFFCQGTFSNGCFRLTFPHGGFWEFNALDGSPEQGYIKRIEERRGNSIRFVYASGKLESISDARSRGVRLEYNPQGLVSKVIVIDFSSRCVQYQYYGEGDTNGSPGDLKHVISPAVTGMPFNNFPGGKTNTFTYTTGFTNNLLNGLLLCAIDGKGQKWLRNAYYTDPTRPSFGRVFSQTWGNDNERLHFTYVRQEPTAGNRFCIQKTIVNDRRGVVKEFCYDAANHLLEQCVYTGFANPLQPTTEILNRPAGKLRPEDPDCWRTRYEWTTNDSLLKKITLPNGNSVSNVYQAEVAPTSRRFRANLRERWEFPGPLGGDQSVRKQLFEYATDFGGCCGFNFVTQHTDSRSNVTVMAYDQRGNRTNITGRIPSILRDFQYNSIGQMVVMIGPDNGSGYRPETRNTYHSVGEGESSGLLSRQIVDAAGESLSTLYEYNEFGILTNICDPGEHVTSWVVNQLDQVLVRLSPAIQGVGGDVQYFQNTFYDANNFIAKTETSHFDEQGLLQLNFVFTTEFHRDVLNVITQKVEEVSGTNFIVTQFLLNPDHVVVETRFGEATSGRQLCNTVASIFDERRRVFRKIRAPGCPEQSTDQFNYDGNLNLTCTIQGLEGLQPRTNCAIYNGYNLPVLTIDAMGNRHTSEYDGNGNVVRQLIQGELCDVPGNGANVRLYEKRTFYDDEDRRIREEVQHFDTDTQAPVPGGDGVAKTSWEWTANSQVARVVNDNLHETLLSYDGAYRLSVTTDHKGNTRRMSYDQDSLVTSVTEVEKSDLGNPDQMFTQTMAYDELHRLTRITDNVGNSQEYRYDSRGNRTLVIDALGNEMRQEVDGLDRLSKTTLDLDGDGADGDGADIVTTQYWDDSSRLISKVDPNGNATTYLFDPLNRIIQEDLADCTTQLYGFDVHDNLVLSTDPNGSVATNRHDLANRLTRRDVVRGGGVSGTTIETYCYDGLSRLTRASDDDSVVSRSHDSLSQVIRESQELIGGGPAQTNRCLYDAVGNMTECTYPGGRVISVSHDELERKSIINDSDFSLIASYSYIGPGRVERRSYGNFTQTDYTFDGITGTPNATNDFGVKKVVGIKHSVSASGLAIDHRAYAWDQVYNKRAQKDLTEGPQFVHEYTYDDTVYRLRQTIVRDRDFPAAGMIRRNENYGFDKTGNRTNIVGGLNPGNYAMDATLCEPADRQMNQYTSVPTSLSPTNEVRSSDANGNTSDLRVYFVEGDQQRLCTYDYRNQMVQFDDRRTAPLPAGQRTTYAYDALGRRIARVVDVDGTPMHTRYFYDEWQVVEERDSLGNTTATYVYGLYVDEVLNMHRSGMDYYYHADDIYSVRAITDGSGNVVERYEYGDYGQVLDGSTLNARIGPLGTGNPSSVGNPCFFTGRRLDPESQWYDYRTRYLNPIDGRFTTRDSIGTWGDVANLGNGYAYVGNRPHGLDPYGAIRTVISSDPERRDRRLADRGRDRRLADRGSDSIGPPPPHEVVPSTAVEIQAASRINVGAALEDCPGCTCVKQIVGYWKCKDKENGDWTCTYDKKDCVKGTLPFGAPPSGTFAGAFADVVAGESDQRVDGSASRVVSQRKTRVCTEEVSWGARWDMWSYSYQVNVCAKKCCDRIVEIFIDPNTGQKETVTRYENCSIEDCGSSRMTAWWSDGYD